MFSFGFLQKILNNFLEAITAEAFCRRNMIFFTAKCKNGCCKIAEHKNELEVKAVTDREGAQIGWLVISRKPLVLRYKRCWSTSGRNRSGHCEHAD